jgi:NitT/TauT family transport system substrate-binding protein
MNHANVNLSIVRLDRRAFLAASAAAAVAPSPASAQTRPTIRLGAQDTDTFGEPLYGVDAGIFARAGLDVELTIFSATGPTADAIAGAAIDVGLIDPIVLANAVNRNVPLMGIAASGLFHTKEPTSGLCVSKNSSLRTAKDFEGQVIGVGTLASLTTISLRMWLARNGADVAKVNFLEMPFADMAPSLDRKSVAAAYITEPLLTRYAADLQMIATPYSAIADTFPISLFAANQSWLAANTETARRLVAAIYETARWANQNRALSAPMLAKHSKLELAVIQRMRRTPFATSFNVSTLQPILDAAYAYKLIDQQTKAADLVAHLG